MHDRVHDPFFTESRKDVLYSRAMPVHSGRMGIAGECDLVEFQKSKSGVALFHREELYEIYPIEYKKGKPKESECDVLQLTAEAMCLEEMFLTEIKEGALYYGEVKSRQKVVFTDDMRKRVIEVFSEMHSLMNRGYTVKAKMTKSCNACSLQDVCLPKLAKNDRAAQYNREIPEGL